MSASRAGRRRPKNLILPGIDPPPAGDYREGGAGEPEPSVWGDWRPVGWVGSQRPEDVLLPALEARAAQERHEPLTQAQVDVLHNEALLRDCYTTRPWVWSLAAYLAGIARFDCDPFWNPSAQGLAAIQGMTRLDGRSLKTDGLATHADGRPYFWRGACCVNGPHSEPARWVKMSAIHGRDHVVAAVVPCDGVGWYRELGLTCDLEINLGRLNYDAPPGLPPREASPRGSALLIWSPHVRRSPELQRPRAIAVNTGARKPFLAIVRPGLGGPIDMEKIETFDPI